MEACDWCNVGALSAAVLDDMFLFGHSPEGKVVIMCFTRLGIYRRACRLWLVRIDNRRLGLSWLLHGDACVHDVVGGDGVVPAPVKFVCVDVELHIALHAFEEGELLDAFFAEDGEKHLSRVSSVSFQDCVETLPYLATL